MVKVGWLADHVSVYGGAEISGGVLVASAPADIEVVPCPADKRPPSDLDAFVIQNCVTYDQRWIQVLADHPFVKHFRDPWHPGDPVFRRWVLDNVTGVIFNSKLALRSCPWEMSPLHEPALVPPPVDLDLFKNAARPDSDRVGNVFLGRIDYAKGAHRAVDWALRTDNPLDMYGMYRGRAMSFGDLPDSIRVSGQVPYHRVPDILGGARRFVFLPAALESYSRTTVEAWAAGCELVLDVEKLGAWEWIQNYPEMIDAETAAGLFWDTVRQMLL